MRAAATSTAKQDLGGTMRCRDAASTLAWVRPMLPQFGITRLANVTGLDRIGIPVWMCIRPNGRSLSVSQGKGVTAELAQASAAMESIELYHAEHVAPPDLVASYREARRHHAVLDPRDLQPGPCWRTYTPTRPIAWIRGTDLASGEPLFVPHARVNCTGAAPIPTMGCSFVTSTGLASGNHRSEALCHAMFEVIERDCEMALGTDVSGCAARHGSWTPTPWTRRCCVGCWTSSLAPGLSVRMWDMTSDVGIPAYRC